MQILPKKNKDKGTISYFLVISEDAKHSDIIKEYLALKGLDNVKVINKDLLSITPSDVQGDIQAVVLYANKVDDHNRYCELIEQIFSKKIPCILLANNKTLKSYQDLYKEFLTRGIAYLDWESQIDLIYEKIFNFEEIFQNKRSIKISILGTKGGIGNSFIAHHVARIIYERFKSPVLNIQGCGSSSNLDFLSGKHFERDYDSKGEISLFKESTEDPHNYHNPLHVKYNFIVFDHSLQSTPKEVNENILNDSDTVLVIVNYELDSIRKAKELLRINEFLLSVNQGVKKFFLCLNHHDSSFKSAFTPSNLGELIGAKISCVIPYQNINKSTPSTAPSGKTLVALEELVDILVGKKGKKW